MPCKNCNDCKDNGCAPTVYPKCILMDKKYACLGVSIGDPAVKLFDALESACQAGWGGGGGTSLTFNNGLTKTGTTVQLGGTLLKDTTIETLSKDLIIGYLSGLVYKYGLKWGETFGGPGIPGIGFSIANAAGTSEAVVANILNAGVYTGIWTATNGTKLTQVELDDKKASLKYSPDNGTTNIFVRVDNNEITLDGQGRRTLIDKTQVQENISVSTSISLGGVLTIATDGNLIPVTGTTILGHINGPGGVMTGIQPGTRITLQFGEANPSSVQHAAAPMAGAASIFLNGCISWQPSTGDTLSLVYNGKDWSEVGRKACLDSPESWKTIGTVGTMRNGESIPAFSGVIASLFTGRLRQADSVHAEVNVWADFTVNGFGISGIFTLPVGYRPLVPLYYPIIVGSTTSLDTATGYILVQTNGDISLNIDVSGTADRDFRVGFNELIAID